MKKHAFLGLLIICGFLALTSTHRYVTTSATNRSHGTLALNVDLTIDYGNSTQQMFSSLSGNTVFDILNQTTTVTFTQYPYGVFIISINGIENNANDNGFYWQYWVNDELAPIAADNYVLSDNDQVLWKYCPPEINSTTPPTTGIELVLGFVIIGVVGVIVVTAASIVYLKIR